MRRADLNTNSYFSMNPLDSTLYMNNWNEQGDIAVSQNWNVIFEYSRTSILHQFNLYSNLCLNVS